MTAAAAAPRARSLAERLLSGERAALARALTVLERGGEPARALLGAIAPHLGGATVVGFTGPPGAGKSTLVGAFITQERAAGRTVGVIAVDPSSPLSGGAILGDRLRMTAHVADDGVFIRSLASRGHVGGLSPAAAAGSTPSTRRAGTSSSWKPSARVSRRSRSPRSPTSAWSSTRRASATRCRR